jgi:outer membrane protein assembly factor BamB
MIQPRSLSPILLLALVLCAGSVLCTGSVLGPGSARADSPPQLLWSFRANGSLQAIMAAPDIDGDGGADIVFEGYNNGPSGVPHVFAIRGRSAGTGQTLWSAYPTGGASSGGGYGPNCLRLAPDLSHDSVVDVLLGTAWGGRTAYGLNGASGATLWSYDTYAHYGSSNSGWIYAIDGLGSDLTGDGVPEVVFCSGSANDRVHCVNGATGAQIWPYYGGDAFKDVLSCQDINGDGVRDVVAGLGDNNVAPQVIALSGATGSLIWARPVSGSIWNLALAGDLDGDGIREIILAQWGNFLTCINGRTGAVAWSVAASYQQRVAVLEDVDGDGQQDIAVGFNTTSACRVVSGANGATLWTTPTANWTWAVERAGDVNSDGISEVAVGDFNGTVYLLDGVTGTAIYSWVNPTGDKIMALCGAPDLDGDGIADVVAGTQLLSGGTGGWVYALSSPNLASAGPPSASAAPPVLSAPVPNPSTGVVSWRLWPPRAGTARILLLGPDGRRVRELPALPLTAGASRACVWDGRDEGGTPVPAGIYLARLFMDGIPAGENRVAILR